MPPGATRRPEMTSSKISSAPCAVHVARSARRNSARCTSRPALAGSGSTMTHAISAPRSANSRARAGSSSSGSTSVSAAISLGTPAELGVPKVASPEPAFTSSPSAWPW
jgi:hypothetical protein